jgi:hypothetical protein
MAAPTPARSAALRGALALGVLALPIGLLGVSPALRLLNTAQDEPAFSTITGLAGKCLDVEGANPADGTPVQLYDCNTTVAQQWTVGSNGTLRALGKCLDITDGSTADGAKAQLWTCHGGANQVWSINTAHDIVNPQAGKCLDVTDNNPANSTRAQIWTCTGAANQKWTASSQPVAPPVVQPVGDQCWATHYGPQPAGALTSSGELYDNNADTAATSLSREPQLPFGTLVQVTNVANGRSLVVRITDRGTFAQTPQEPKCLDLTDGAFDRLGGSLNPDAGHIVVTQQVLN